MNYSYPQIVLEDIPGYLTLAISISGCPVSCKGCHSAFTWDNNYGNKLTPETLYELIQKHKHIDCVLFYGGEWNITELIPFLLQVRENNLKVALYSGYDYIIPELIEHLDFYKIGPWIPELGNISTPGTNQKLYEIIDDELSQVQFPKRF